MSNGNKRSSDDGNEDRLSKRQRNDYDSINSEIRLLLPSKNVGAVIGKGGENIKRLRREYQAGINLPDSQGPERLVMIRGQIGQICEIIAEIGPLIDKPEGSDDDDCEVRMLVHQSHAGRIIGRGGARVKELKEETQTMVRCYSDCAPDSTERVCQVSGKLEHVVHCIGRILETIDGTPILGMSIPYNPNNYDEGYAHQYGGYVGGRGGGGRGGRDRGDRGDRRGGDMNRGRDYGGRGDYGRDYGSRGGGYGDMGGGFGGGFGGGLMGALAMNMGGMNKTTTSQVSIPKSLAGIIIGKGGSRIRQVQNESGTVIKMDDPSTESDERIITIHGTEEQIQYAQYLLQSTVKQHAGGM